MWPKSVKILRFWDGYCPKNPKKKIKNSKIRFPNFFLTYFYPYIARKSGFKAQSWRRRCKKCYFCKGCFGVILPDFSQKRHLWQRQNSGTIFYTFFLTFSEPQLVGLTPKWVSSFILWILGRQMFEFLTFRQFMGSPPGQIWGFFKNRPHLRFLSK